MHMRDRFARFFYGRYGGNDRFQRFLIAVYLLIIVANLFVRSYILYAIAVLFFAFSIYRILSRNLSRRVAENNRYVRIMGKFTGFFRLQGLKFKERKTHVYRRCPHCKATLRLPREKGTHSVRCPRCHEHFEVHNR